MIDPHVHCRDWAESHKETIAHALSVAERAGLSGIFDMPNTDPPITSRELVVRRLSDAKKANSSVFYGLYVGLTADPNQIREAVEAHRDFFPKQGTSARAGVVGLKMFAGHSVGNLGIIKEEEQRLVYRTLANEGYKGVLVVHCEKESLLRPDIWNPLDPKSHSYARPPEAEVESVRDQINFATEYRFGGKLHIAHVSVPKSVELIDRTRFGYEHSITIGWGVTPHHCCLDYESMPDSSEGLLCKVNPPLRDEDSAKRMLELLRWGTNWIETDHAPHTLAEKTGKALDKKGNPLYMSGFPGLPYYPHFINLLRKKGFSEERVRNLTHNNICNIFGFYIPESGKSPNLELHTEYEVDVYKGLRK